MPQKQKKDPNPAPRLTAELRHLRRACRELVAAHGRKAEGRIALLTDAVKAAVSRPDSKGAGAGLKPSLSRDMKHMLEQIRDFELKPEKGKRKDLRRLEALVEDLLARTDRW